MGEMVCSVPVPSPHTAAEHELWMANFFSHSFKRRKNIVHLEAQVAFGLSICAISWSKEVKRVHSIHNTLMRTVVLSALYFFLSQSQPCKVSKTVILILNWGKQTELERFNNLPEFKLSVVERDWKPRSLRSELNSQPVRYNKKSETCDLTSPGS